MSIFNVYWLYRPDLISHDGATELKCDHIKRTSTRGVGGFGKIAMGGDSNSQNFVDIFHGWPQE